MSGINARGSDVGIHVRHNNLLRLRIGTTHTRLDAMHTILAHDDLRFQRTDFCRLNRVLIQIRQRVYALLDQLWRLELDAVARLIADFCQIALNSASSSALNFLRLTRALARAFFTRLSKLTPVSSSISVCSALARLRNFRSESRSAH